MTGTRGGGTGRTPAPRQPSSRSAASRAGSSRAAASGRSAATGSATGRSATTRSATTRPVRVPVARERGTPAFGLPRAAPSGAARGTVSSTSAARFAERVRRRRLQRMGIGVAALCGGLGLGWLVFASPVFALRAVEVKGLHRLPGADVEALAAAEVGRSMALVSPTTVAERVVELPLVRTVHVDRSWPSTLVVTITEREPIAAVPSATSGRVDLVDGDGVVVETVLRARVPAGVPVVDVDVRRAGPGAVRAARAVADDIPVSLRAGVRTIRATSPDAVSFVLADGSTVIWGSALDGERKSAALVALHPRPLKHKVVIDVSAPDAPAVTGP